jgi:lipid A ethanolaminephosphotransferase
VIELLAAQDIPGAMFYVSDHGESLGENGIYLHGLPYALAPAEQTSVPMLFWASDSFLAQKEIDLTALQSHRHISYSHDNIFHSMLGLFGVKTGAYHPGLDLFAGSRQRHG